MTQTIERRDLLDAVDWPSGQLGNSYDRHSQVMVSNGKPSEQRRYGERAAVATYLEFAFRDYWDYHTLQALDNHRRWCAAPIPG